MHLLELDIGRTVRAFVLTCFCLLMIVPTMTLQAQSATSTPSPASTLVNDFNSLKDSIGVVGALLIGVVVVILAIFYLIARYYVSPMASSQTAKDQAIITMASQVSTAGAQTATTLGQSAQLHSETATFMKGMLTQMNELQTRTEAEKQQQAIQANSNSARDAINTHFDEVVAPVKQAVDNTLASVKSIEAKVDELMMIKGFSEELKDVRNDIAELRRTIEERLLPPLAPPEAAQAPPNSAAE